MQFRGRIHTFFVCALVSLIALPACTAGPASDGPTSTVSPTSVEAPGVDYTSTTATASTTVTPGGAVTWTNCGEIECGVLKAPASHREPGGRLISVGVYVRRAVAPRVGTLVLLPDYDGATARDLATVPVVHVGAAARRFDVMAVSPRGFYDSTPLPCAHALPYVPPDGDAFAVSASCRSDESLNSVVYGALEAVSDLELLVSSENTGPVSVVGWGRGATIAAAWKLLHPSSVSTMVLDSPDDPGISQRRVAQLNRAAEDAGVNNVMKWCTAHLSCPLFENAAKRANLVLTRIREGRANAGVTVATFRIAFRNTISSGDYGALFQALSRAENDDYAPLVALAGADAAAAGSRFAAVIAGACGDMSAAEAELVMTDDAAFEETVFRVGMGDTLARICSGLPEPTEPIGAVRAADGARGSRVQVFVAAADGITSPEMVQAFAKRAAWKFRAVKANRHLVVGFDRTTTDWVSNFLLEG